MKTVNGTIQGVVHEMALIETQPTSKSAGSCAPLVMTVSSGHFAGDEVTTKSHVWRIEGAIY